MSGKRRAGYTRFVPAPKPIQPGEIVGSADQRVFLHDFPWSHFEVILALRGDRSVPRMTYLRGELELMSPSQTHESISSLLGRLLELYALERDVPLNAYGSWTVRHAPAERGVEPDKCYIVGDPRGRDRPDLAEVHRGLGVPEIWIWRDAAIRVFRLQGGRYEEAESSELFPDIDLRLLGRLAGYEIQTQAIVEFRDWIRSAQR